MRAQFPFSALVGQDTMKLALVLNAVNPRLGGVLIRGQKGTAKSTAARGLAALLPPVDVVAGCRFGCSPVAADVRCPECAARRYPTDSVERAVEFVELPIGATEDRVLGSLDMERALLDGQRHFEPGLLARANRGLLYVDEVNLLPDHLVDTLLDAAAMGVNSVERDGVSFSHPAAFVLVGTMNPEEGELRPQLLDRFALAVDVEGMLGASERVEVVRRRIAFEADPAGFAVRWQGAECAEQERIRAARALLPRVAVGDNLLELIARICTAFEVDGLRADIVIYKTAATLAAYSGRERVTAEDIRRAAELALPHRSRRQPFDQPGLDHQRLDQIVDEHTRRSEPDEPNDPPSGRGDGDPLPQEPSDGDVGDNVPSERAEEVFEVAAAQPLPLLPPTGPPPRGGLNERAGRRARAIVEGPRGRHVRSSAQKSGALDVVATLRAAAPFQAERRRAAADEHLRVQANLATPRTRPNPTQAPRPVEAGNLRLQLQATDLRYKVRALPLGALTVFVVDASGSMAARRRMALAKGAVQSLLLRAYQTREEVALIAFRGSAAEVLLPPTSSVHLAAVRLRALPTGGRTPLALALSRAADLLAQRTATRHERQRSDCRGQGWVARRSTTRQVWSAQRSGPVQGGPIERSPTRQRQSAIHTLVLVSDGRANVALAGGDPYADALHEARTLRAAGVHAVVVDSEEGQVRLGRARMLAAELGAEYVRLAELSVGGLAETVRSQPGARYP
jgi:magnesium chelatase subunit D